MCLENGERRLLMQQRRGRIMLEKSGNTVSFLYAMDMFGIYDKSSRNGVFLFLEVNQFTKGCFSMRFTLFECLCKLIF